MQDFIGHEQLEARDRWHEIASPAGPLAALIPPFNIDGVDAVMGGVPALGEHTDAILLELGYDAATAADWRRRGVI